MLKLTFINFLQYLQKLNLLSIPQLCFSNSILLPSAAHHPCLSHFPLLHFLTNFHIHSSSFYDPPNNLLHISYVLVYPFECNIISNLQIHIFHISTNLSYLILKMLSFYKTQIYASTSFLYIALYAG